MWAQLVVMRVKPGKDGDVPRLYELLEAAEQPGSGLVRTTGAATRRIRVASTTSCSSRVRRRHGREQDPRRQESVAGVVP